MDCEIASLHVRMIDCSSHRWFQRCSQRCIDRCRFSACEKGAGERRLSLPSPFSQATPRLVATPFRTYQRPLGLKRIQVKLHLRRDHESALAPEVSRLQCVAEPGNPRVSHTAHTIRRRLRRLRVPQPLSGEVRGPIDPLRHISRDMPQSSIQVMANRELPVATAHPVCAETLLEAGEDIWSDAKSVGLPLAGPHLGVGEGLMHRCVSPVRAAFPLYRLGGSRTRLPRAGLCTVFADSSCASVEAAEAVASSALGSAGAGEAERDGPLLLWEEARVGER